MSRVVGVHRSATHSFTKPTVKDITLVVGHGVEGDAHAGSTVQHLSRIKRDPTKPNLRQVHLMPKEILDELDVSPGALGENVTTEGIDLLKLPVGTRLRLGMDAAVELTGLRNPCAQIEAYRPGLLKQVLGRAENGQIVRRAGVMSVVRTGGFVRPGDAVHIELPDEHVPLDYV